MERNFGRPNRTEGVPPSALSLQKSNRNAPANAMFGSVWDRIAFRLILAAACVAIGYHFHPFGLQQGPAALAGLGFAGFVFVIELRLNRANLLSLICASVGYTLGIFIA